MAEGATGERVMEGGVLARLPRWGAPWPTVAAAGVLTAVAAAVSAVAWPGQANLDVTAEYGQALSGVYDDWHAPVLSALWHLLVVAGLRDPGWVLFPGVLALLVGFYLLLRLRLSRPLALLAATAVLLFPPVLNFAVELGTDAWVTAPLVCGFGLVARLPRTTGRVRAVLVAAVVACALFAQAARPTATVPVAVLFLALGLALCGVRWRRPRRLLAVTAAAAAGAALVTGGVLGVQYGLIHARQTHPEQATYEYDLVGMSLHEGRVLFPPEVSQRSDLAYYRRTIVPGGIDVGPILWGPEPAITVPLTPAHFVALRGAWLDAVRHDPVAYLRGRARTALWLLGISAPVPFAWFGPPSAQFPDFQPRNPTVHRPLQAWLALGASADGSGGPLQAVWVYVLLVLVLGIAGLRGRRAADVVPSLLAAAAMAYVLEILVAAPTVEYRYVYPAVAVGTVLAVLELARLAAYVRPATKAVPAAA